jgi:nucleotide-binding universal stress UspA family protein
MKNVLVAILDLNGKKASQELVDQATKVLGSVDEEKNIVLLHVIDEGLIEEAAKSGAYIGQGLMDTKKLREKLIAGSINKAREYTEEIKNELHKHGFDADTDVWVGPPASIILQESKALKADVIIVVEHRRSFINSIFGGDGYGWLCCEIIERSDVPVVVITPKSIRFTDVGKRRSTLPTLGRVEVSHP